MNTFGRLISVNGKTTPSTHSLLKNTLATALLSFLFLTILPTAQAQTHTFGTGFNAQPGPETGTVILRWQDTDIVTNYNIAYGTTHHSHTYGAIGIGDVDSYLVRGLTPGQRYYFTLSPVVNNVGLGYVPEVTAVATGTGVNPNHVSRSTFYAPYGGPTSDQYQLRATPGPGKGQVSLSWSNTMNAHDFDVVYGTSTVFQHGAQNVGQGTNQVVINGLSSGVAYYFSVLAEDSNDKPLTSFSAPVAQIAR